MSDTTSGPDADLYGDPTLLLGLPATIKALIAGMAVTELKYDGEVQFQAQAEGQNADVAAFAVSKKLKYSGTGSGYLLDYAAFKAVKTFTDGTGNNAITLIITKWGKAYNYKEYQKADFSFVGFDGIAPQTTGS